MPVETSIDRALGIAIHTVTVELLADETAAAQRRLSADPEHRATMPVVWDLRDVALTTLAYEEMRELAARAEAFYQERRSGRIAIVVGSQADFGMGRMYQSLAAQAPRELRVFHDYDEAVAWLSETPAA